MCYNEFMILFIFFLEKYIIYDFVTIIWFQSIEIQYNTPYKMLSLVSKMLLSSIECERIDIHSIKPYVHPIEPAYVTKVVVLDRSFCYPQYQTLYLYPEQP